MLGKVLTAAVKKTVEVQVVRYALNEHPAIMAHFKQRTNFNVLDEKLETKIGDWVLIEKLPEKYSLSIEHKIMKIIWMNGNIIDPITGKKCVKTDFEEDLDREAKLLGGKPFSERLEELRTSKKE